MSETWHWKFYGTDDDWVRTSEGDAVVQVGFNRNERDADARLISAAPDLLEAAKAAFVALPMSKHNEDINAALKAAIAKAEGR